MTNSFSKCNLLFSQLFKCLWIKYGLCLDITLNWTYKCCNCILTLICHWKAKLCIITKVNILSNSKGYNWYINLDMDNDHRFSFCCQQKVMFLPLVAFSYRIFATRMDFTISHAELSMNWKWTEDPELLVFPIISCHKWHTRW